MRDTPQNMIGQSPALTAALDHLSLLATIDRPVLILGERGTGKELAAERLHYLSPRWSEAFIKVNCSAITETLLESELFGHEAGAFTGATKQHIGRFERADGGSLFLDELGTMSLRLQEKLLRLIEYGEFERVGGQKTIKVDVRIIGATNASLPDMANAGEFRWDLLDRLSFDVVNLPPLRERPEDIAELANHFAVRFAAELGWEFFPGFTNQALSILESHPWYGNIRELKNAVERSIFRWGQQTTRIDTLVLDAFSHKTTSEVSTEVAGGAVLEEESRPLQKWPIDLKLALASKEKELSQTALRAAAHNQREAAALLNLTYDQMRSIVRKHGLGRSKMAKG